MCFVRLLEPLAQTLRIRRILVGLGINTILSLLYGQDRCSYLNDSYGVCALLSLNFNSDVSLRILFSPSPPGFHILRCNTTIADLFLVFFLRCLCARQLYAYACS